MWPRARTRLTAVYWLVRVECVIRRRRVDALAAMTGVRLDLTPSPPPAALQSPQRELPISHQDVSVLRLVSRLYAPWPHSGTCLRECLVAGRLLRYREPVLRIGVRQGPQRLLMHAWLEIDGVALDPTATRYATLGAV